MGTLVMMKSRYHGALIEWEQCESHCGRALMIVRRFVTSFQGPASAMSGEEDEEEREVWLRRFDAAVVSAYLIVDARLSHPEVVARCATPRLVYVCRTKS
jgi:hypothetical protein